MPHNFVVVSSTSPRRRRVLLPLACAHTLTSSLLTSLARHPSAASPSTCTPSLPSIPATPSRMPIAAACPVTPGAACSLFSVPFRAFMGARHHGVSHRCNSKGVLLFGHEGLYFSSFGCLCPPHPHPTPIPYVQPVLLYFAAFGGVFLFCSNSKTHHSQLRHLSPPLLRGRPIREVTAARRPLHKPILPQVPKEEKEGYVKHVMHMLKLTPIKDCLIGTRGKGLSVEQVKRYGDAGKDEAQSDNLATD